ncbi:beta-ketoacyl-[acyl-carrier-protein] synthase family protein [Phytoactinopolyspora endophytica]|uniref:beta-ketoacyl-[acyl-carrier-protein] synthase family protein n=1 Tax=Phytoactinopolyspora endophytica TaxID=1642495 RepID=UPI00101DFCF8|nr:beta-ketoacyl-[acyl-carrier-protein] synthase family protein [Phytoactinopolyspora endophytica]
MSSTSDARRVVITGIGAVTPLGNDAPSTWASLAAGRSGVREITTFDASTFPVRIAGQVTGFGVEAAIPARRHRRYLSRGAGYGVAAAIEALRQAGPLDGSDPYRRGVSVGGTVGRVELQELADMSWQLESTGHTSIYRQSPAEVMTRDQNAAPAVMAEIGDLRGPFVAVSTACAGSAHAIGEAFRQIEEGDADIMLAGGYDALTTWMDVLGFALLGALTVDDADRPGRACKPFDVRRNGFVLGEGAVMVVLEEREHALARNALILAELAGYASSLNAYRITDSPPDGGGAISAMREAVLSSALAPEDVDYIVAHGTGTPGNDASETVAIKEVFGPHAYDVLVSSPKSMAGHLTSAAAGLNLVAALGSVRYDVVPPTINLVEPDPKLDLDYVPGEARRSRIQNVLVNAFAFGGTNACFVVTAHEPVHDDRPPTSARSDLT